MDITYTHEPIPSFTPITLHITCNSQEELNAITNVLDDPCVMRASHKTYGAHYDPHTFAKFFQALGIDTMTSYAVYRTYLRDTFGK